MNGISHQTLHIYRGYDFSQTIENSKGKEIYFISALSSLARETFNKPALKSGALMLKIWLIFVTGYVLCICATEYRICNKHTRTQRSLETDN